MDRYKLSMSPLSSLLLHLDTLVWRLQMFCVVSSRVPFVSFLFAPLSLLTTCTVASFPTKYTRIHMYIRCTLCTHMPRPNTISFLFPIMILQDTIPSNNNRYQFSTQTIQNVSTPNITPSPSCPLPSLQSTLILRSPMHPSRSPNPSSLITRGTILPNWDTTIRRIRARVCDWIHGKATDANGATIGGAASGGRAIDGPSRLG